MRIQYRYRSTIYVVNFQSEPEWTPWKDWPIDKSIEAMSLGICARVQTRIVDNAGNVVEQTPAFKPAYYQRTSDTSRKHGGITWCDVEPDKAHWKRRDDIKP